MANFAAVRTRYYKHTSAIAVLDHANSKRNGFTHSMNVHNEFSSDNEGNYLEGTKSCSEGYERTWNRHKDFKNGKKPRSDMNTLFEHVVILSVGQYEELEGELGSDVAKQEIMKGLAEYALKIEENFGFTPIGFDLHLDEGTKADDGTIKRNVHAHVMFYNYDFNKELSPLRNLMAKGINSKSGKTRELNPNFEKMQDLVASSFDQLGFVRGNSRGIDNLKHKTKSEFVKNDLARKQIELVSKDNDLTRIQIELDNREMDLAMEQIELTRIETELSENETLISDLKARVLDYKRNLIKLRSMSGEFELVIKKALQPLLDAVEGLLLRVDTKTIERVQGALRKYDEVKPEMPDQISIEIEQMINPFRPTNHR
jgi:hypothetical protein